MRALTIPASFQDEMVEHARRELPNECCGVLAGYIGLGHDVVTAVIPTINAAASPWMFEIGPDEQDRVRETVRWDEGEIPLATYHSHTAGPAVPSGTDRAMALEDSICVIVAFDRDVPVVRAWFMRDARTEPERVSVFMDSEVAIAHAMCDSARSDREGER